MTALWIGLAIVLIAAAFFLFVPKRIAGIKLLKKELQKRGIPHSHLPEEFFTECIDWAERVAKFAGYGSTIKQRAEFVRAIETMANMVELWRRDPGSPMFATHGSKESSYRQLFERYDLQDQDSSPEQIYSYNLGSEVDRLFDDSSLVATERPKAVILMGGVASGKTTIRRQRFSKGFVLIDAAEIFHHLTPAGQSLDFPQALQEPLEIIGSMVARKAIKERRNIVTEIIGDEVDPTMELLSALKDSGYDIEPVGVTCSVEQALERNANRGDNISAYYAGPFQQRWIVQACKVHAGAP